LGRKFERSALRQLSFAKSKSHEGNTNGEGTDRFSGSMVTPGTLEFLGLPALVGRVVQPADYEPGATPVFVLRYKTWVNRFNADPSIVQSQNT
jgi:hypothetical protein